MNHFDIRPLIEELPEVEFQALLNWIFGPERDRRKTLAAEAQAQITQIANLREMGVLPKHEEGAEYKTGAVYLPSETAKVGDEKFIVISIMPTSENPTESKHWESIGPDPELVPEGEIPLEDQEPVEITK